MLDVTLRDKVKNILTPSGRGNVPPFMVMDVMAAAARIEAEGGHVIHMEVGQPAAPAPKTAIAAAHAALEIGKIDYTAAVGIPSLRQRIARHYRETYNQDINPARIVITTSVRRERSCWDFSRCSSRGTGSLSRLLATRHIGTF